MKKARICLSAILVLSILGGTLAFKIKITDVLFYTYRISATAPTSKYILGASLSGVVPLPNTVPGYYTAIPGAVATSTAIFAAQ